MILLPLILGEMKTLLKLVLTDIGGVWTDAGMYYDNTGNELKKINTSDSAGLIFFRHLNIPVGIITGEDAKIVERRADKLNINLLYQGIKDKVAAAETIFDEMGISLGDVAYIGDDLGDYQLLKKVGVSGAPHNASDYIKEVVDIVTMKAGGEGAYREFVETILVSNGYDLAELTEEITSK